MKTKSFMELDPFGFVVKRKIDLKTGMRVMLLLAMAIGLANAGVFVENATNITYSGDYAIVTFLSNGSITVVNDTLYNVSFLVVAGGGAGGNGGFYAGGGGGAGGVTEVTGYTLSNTTFPVIVGAGGAKTASTGGNGNASSFASFTMNGGGGGSGGLTTCGGCGNCAVKPNAGGSGGGGTPYSICNSVQNLGEANTSILGSPGGNGTFNFINTKNTGGGGGGAVSNGTSGSNVTFSFPNGGDGYCTSISGTYQCYGGGGGGGAYGLGTVAGEGGSGGGGDGGVAVSATGGTGAPNASNGNYYGGGGGGGAGVTGYGGNGASGVVIIKMNISYYPQPSNATGYLTYCGNETNTTAITWVVYDLITGNQIQNTITANMQQVFNNSLLTQNFTSTVNNSTNFSLCIYPENETAYAQTTDTITAIGYNPYYNTRLPTYYTNNTTIYTAYLLTTNESKLVQIYVVDNILAPMLNVSVQIQQVNPLTSELMNLGSFAVDSFGTTTQPLQPATQVYHFTVLNSSGSILQDFANQAIPCNSYDLVCQLILIVNPMGGVGYTNGTFNGVCGWNNATGVLNCTPSGITPLTTNLLVGMINATTSNATVCNVSGAGAATVSCTLSNSSGNCYNYVYSANMTTGEEPTLDGGMVCVSSQTLTNYGGTGLLFTFILVAVMAIVGLAFGATGACIGASFGIMIALAFSFVTGLAWFGGIMAIAGLWIVAYEVR